MKSSERAAAISVKKWKYLNKHVTHLVIEVFSESPQAWMSLDSTTLLVGSGKEKRAAFQAELDPELPVFYFPDFFLREPRPWVQFSSHKRVALADPLPLCQNNVKKEVEEWVIPEQEKELFDSAFAALQEEFKRGALEKAVLYVFARAFTPFTPDAFVFHLIRAVAHLKKASGHLYAYLGKEGGFVGVTPEILFTHDRTSPRLIHTCALAGTLKGSRQAEAFKSNPKLMREHALTVEGICSSLQHLGACRRGHADVCLFPMMTHFRTAIQLNLQAPFQFEACVRSLHPTPALGAYPRGRGGDWLRAYDQKIPRAHYGAPMGVVDPVTGISACYVGIRQISWDAKEMRAGVGCGVVRESSCAEEWAEILLKFASIRSLFTNTYI